MNYLSIDVGTTGCKCQLFSEDGEILQYLFEEYDFKDVDGFHYVNLEAIEAHLRKMISEVSREFAVDSVCISSMGESFVLLDADDNVLFYPMLYTDSRGEEEAEEIKRVIGEERAFFITGVVPHSMYSLSKLLYVKNHAPALFEKADKVMLICDYIGYLLTGERMIDYALASRTGAFDIEKMCFSKEVLGAFGIDPSLFSKPQRAGSVVGKIKEEWGIDATLVLGSHDQVCTSLGAGVLQEGDAVDGMGTVECITTLFSKKPEHVRMGKQGYPCVPYPVEGLYCTYILNYSCGSTVNWLRKRIMHGYRGEERDFFTYMEKEMSDTPTGILTLPYFGGASTPYQDLDAKGVIVNLTTDTRDCDLYRSVMEGTAFEMRLNADEVLQYGITVRNAVATGGGANSARWMQIKSDIQEIPIKVLRSSEGGLCGCAMLQAVAMGGAKDLYAARDIFVRYAKEFHPNEASHAAYESHYQKYKKLYKTIKEFY
jgi:xylulokinase